MSINICFSVLLIVSGIFTYVNSQDAIRQYVIRKDFFNGIKAAEFSIYDKNENIQYRIESSYSVMQSVKLIAYPSKQEVGRLKAQINFLTYKAEISILDSQTNQWINGLVEQDFQFIGTSCNINWNGNRITMENDIASFTSKFRNTNGQLLAQFRLRPASIFVTNKYDMQIFSNQYPDQLYLLALAAREQIRSAKKNG
jgi:uncharacterized protein YxjI